MTIELVQKYYDDSILFKKPSAEFEPGVTVLVGCNGYGKSTMLASIRDHCKENNIKFIEFDSMQDRSIDKSKAGFYGDMTFLATSMTASEGENITLSLGKFAQRLGSFVRKNKDQKTLVILMDAVDSGYSIDNIEELKELLFKTVLDDCTGSGIELYLILTANSYELTRDFKCFDPVNCKYIKFKDYDNYREYILKTRKTKNKRS